MMELRVSELGFPHDFLAADFARSMIHGGALERLDVEDRRRRRRP